MSNYFYSALIKYRPAFFILIFAPFTHFSQASLLANCKYLEETSSISRRLSSDDFIRHINDLKRSNQTLRIYEPSQALQSQKKSMLDHFESLLPELAPVNIHKLKELLVAYLLNWEKGSPFESMSLIDSSHRFVLFSTPQRKSLRVRFHKETSDNEEQVKEPLPAATACISVALKRTEVFLYNPMDPDYSFGFVIRSASGKRTYLICREPALSPSPSVTEPSPVATGFCPPGSTPQSVQMPSDMIVDLLAQQLASQGIFSGCSQ